MCLFELDSLLNFGWKLISGDLEREWISVHFQKKKTFFMGGRTPIPDFRGPILTSSNS